MENDREVATEKGQALAKKFECDFVETSAKTNLNVDKAFESIVKQIMGAKKEHGKGGNKKDCVIQ